MRSAHKLRSMPLGGDAASVVGRYAEGHVTGVRADGKASFRDESDEVLLLRIPRHIDQRWLVAAAALAPVPAVALCLEHGKTPVLAHVFSAPEHAALDEHFHVEAKSIELLATESVEIRTGKSIVRVSADGEIQVRGRNVTSRASNVNRVRGGAVRIN